MSAHKRILLLLVLITAAVAGVAATSEAQFRGRRVVIPRAVIVGGYYADPYWLYDPWFGYGYQYPFGPYPYPPYRYYNMDPGSSVRLEVKPNEAEVYVDGYYAGVVDDFDGAFQRLRVSPGEHEIALHLDGYRGVIERGAAPVADRSAAAPPVDADLKARRLRDCRRGRLRWARRAAATRRCMGRSPFACSLQTPRF